MRRFFDSIKGRVAVALVLFVMVAQLSGLWFYSARSEAAIDLLHDTLMAERMALIVRSVDLTPAADRKDVTAALNGLGLQAEVPDAIGDVDTMRSHLMRHLLGAFLGRPNDAGIGVQYALKWRASPTERTVSLVNTAAHMDEHHRAYTPIAEIKREGTIVADVVLTDGSRLKMAVPALTATSFSPYNLGGALTTVALSALLAVIWLLHRWTQPLMHFAAAADRLGSDIKAAPLAVQGLYEVRTAAHAFNRMQERIQKLVEDRSAMAAAIAHDLGTPITRLRLRAEEIEDPGVKGQVLNDIEQMRRMMSSTLEFSRLNSDTLPIERIDLTSLVEAVCSDFIDLGGSIKLSAPPRLLIESDPMSIRRVMINLLENAVRYGNEVHVALEKGALSVRLLVDDDGPGIPMELRATALAPFCRLQRFEGEIPQGSGLGLAIAHNLAARLGGNIELGVSPLGGLRVAIVLPRR